MTLGPGISLAETLEAKSMDLLQKILALKGHVFT